MSRARTSCVVAAGALLLVLIVAGVLGGILWSQTHGNERALLAQYEQISEQSRTRTYSRAADPPGWTLEQGAAAELYQEAWGACDLDNMPDAVRGSLTDAVRAYSGDPTPGQADANTPLLEAGSHPGWDQCRSAGIPDLEDDLVIAQLTPEACDQYAACWPALELVRRGSRRADTTSPVHLWSSWSAVDGGPDYRSLVPFMHLSRMELLAGYVAGLHGDPWALAESACTVLRYGHDLGQGSGLLGTMVGVTVQHRAADVLFALITSDALPAAERERLIRELHYINRHGFSIQQAVEGEYLTLGALWVHRQLPVPPTSLLPTGNAGLAERMMMSRFADDHHRLGDELLPALDATYPERIGAYDALINAVDDPWMVPDYTQYDARLTATQTRLRMLEIAAADGAFRATHGRAPAGLNELAADYPDLPRTDPLTEDGFVLVTKDGRRMLRSKALGVDGEPARPELIGTSHNFEAMLQLDLPGEEEP